MHVDTWLAWVAGTELDHSEIEEPLTGIPTLFGGNFQAVSVAQKSYGYVAGSLTFTPELVTAFEFVDTSIGKVVAALKAKGVFDDTLIMVASKHGQAPIDPTLYGKVSQDVFQSDLAAVVPVDFITTDDIALIYLHDSRDTDKAVDYLNTARNTLKIDDIISGDRLTYLGYGDPATDPAVPDIIVRPELGIIYTTSTSKIAEHGGLSDDDRKVSGALLLLPVAQLSPSTICRKTFNTYFPTHQSRLANRTDSNLFLGCLLRKRYELAEDCLRPPN